MEGAPSLAAIGAFLVAMAAGIAAYQMLRAPRCPRHRPRAGWAAWLLAVVCAAGGALLLIRVAV